MRRRLFLRTGVVLALVAVAVSMAVVVARGGGERGRPAATAGTRSVATPAKRLIGPSAGRWKGGVQPLLGAKTASKAAGANCPKHTKSWRRPADFPASFPFPKGMVMTEVRRYATPPVVYVIGVAPLSLQGAARFFVRELPLHAYYITSSEAEPIEVEARFDGPARGALKVVSLPRCSSAVWMLVGVSKSRR